MKKSQNPEVTGIIMPNNWDSDGKVVQIAIYTNEEEVYLVEHNHLGHELLNHINRRVEVRGKKKECRASSRLCDTDHGPVSEYHDEYGGSGR